MTQLVLDGGVESAAVFSPCRTWRYMLRRQWAAGDPLVVIGLNPSTADETQDDPTVARCVKRARRWGFPGLLMMNAYALRSTDPRGLWRVADPVGPENDRWLREAAAYARSLFLAAWGAHCTPQREAEVARIFPAARLVCLGRTKAGRPRHPLYIAGDAEPVPFEPVAP